MSDKSYYRPTALVTAASKILNTLMLDNIESHIEFSTTQSRFKRKQAEHLTEEIFGHYLKYSKIEGYHKNFVQNTARLPQIFLNPVRECIKVEFSRQHVLHCILMI